MKGMRIIFFGSPRCALPSLEKLLDDGHRIELVITQPDKPSGRGRAATPPPVKEFAQSRGISVLQPEKIRQDEKAIEALKEINPDIIVVVAYGQILPAAIIYLPTFKSVNVHFSLLPRYRGAAPVAWAILRGEEKTGVTIFELDEKMDEGDILAAEEVAILPGENSQSLEMRLSQVGAELLVRTLREIEHIRHSPQNHSQATYAPRLKKEDGKISWTKEAAFVERMVRAFFPWPRAYTFLKHQRLIILRGRALAQVTSSRRPGQILEARKEGLAVCCGGGTVFLVERLQRENRKEMDAASFLRGIKIEPGDSFE